MSYQFNARGAFLPRFLGFVIVLFFSILAVIWYVAERVDPVILDETGGYRTGGHGRAQ